ncbi:rhodanese-like domain-containing protein [Oceanibium sediminis]|uniref:rhodanese-like domain-containing protein n=1 Tax=Oceanibium sediminis TaxID=2026339 RepID=UPI000DD493AC|nr:rhodanese-like domain-containing protein [Oceanibium sediminis]
MKTAKDYLDEAHAVVPKISPEEGITRHGGSAVFVDVRDSGEIAASGTIAGAVRVSRGFIEFAADSSTPHHHPAFQKDAELILICGAGGQAALAGKTLKDMGFTNVFNVGGFSAWKEAGGPTEE